MTDIDLRDRIELTDGLEEIAARIAGRYTAVRRLEDATGPPLARRELHDALDMIRETQLRLGADSVLWSTHGGTSSTSAPEYT